MKAALVGAGPGDPGLLTIRGRELLAEADVIIYDALANPALLEFARPEAELIYVGKIADRHALPQAEINRLIADKVSENKNVVRLKGGDPYIFGRGGEEGEYLTQRRIPFEVVPGISSAIAAPAYAGIPLTHRGYVSSVSIITGHENPDKPDSSHNWDALAQSGSTLVFVMGVKNLLYISNRLIQAGMPPETPAALIYRGTTPAQRSLYSTISDIPTQATMHNFTNPAVLVIGKVVSLHDKLDWFQKKPLLGKKIIVTRARSQASELARRLASLGADVIQSPAIEIVPIQERSLSQDALEKLQDYDWLIFTSANGVEKFMQLLWEDGRDARALAHCRIAVIGPATQASLARHGLRADLMPASFVAESVAKAMAEVGLEGQRILLARAREARDALPQLLNEAGATVDILPLYETRMGAGNPVVKERLENGEIDCITFTSSSTVRNFLKLYSVLQNPPVLASIGPITTATLAEAGLKADVQAEEFTIPGLVTGLVEYYTRGSACSG